MQKIYGFKQDDLISLAKIVNKRQGQSLTQIFKNFALKTGKAQGTVRNLYYALIKLSQSDAGFTHKYLSGKPLNASKIERFNPEQEEWLVKTVLKEQEKGRSARSIINELAGGDLKLALRYQNKFRTAINGVKYKSNAQKNQNNSINNKDFAQSTVLKLKKEINGLIERLTASTNKENALLKARVDFLERENLRLNNLLYGSPTPNAVKFFTPPLQTNTIQ